MCSFLAEREALHQIKIYARRHDYESFGIVENKTFGRRETLSWLSCQLQFSSGPESLVLLEDCRREREKCYFESKIIEIWDDSGVTAEIEADEDQTIPVTNDFEALEEVEGKKMTQLYIGYREVTV